MPRFFFIKVSSLKHYQLKYTNRIISAPHSRVCPVLGVSMFMFVFEKNEPMWIHTVAFPVRHTANACRRCVEGLWCSSYLPVDGDGDSGAPSSGYGLSPDLPAWLKPESEQLLLSSLHINWPSCSGINRPPAPLSAPMCASRSVCVHSSQSGCFHICLNACSFWF